MNARRVFSHTTAALVLFAAPGALTAQGSCMTVGPLSPTCVNDAQGKPVYSFTTDVTNQLGCTANLEISPFAGTGGTVQPSTISIGPGGPTKVAFSLVNPAPGAPLAAFSYTLTGCGLSCSHVNRIPFPPCSDPPNDCKLTVSPLTGKLCAPQGTQVDLQPPVPAGNVTWYQTTSCGTTAQPPQNPWAALSGGTSWHTLALSQTTCYQALLSGAPGCPGRVLSNVARVDVTKPAAPGPLQCSLSGGGSCPDKVCSPAALSLQAKGAPGCSLQWQQLTGSGWQNVTGATSPVFSPPPLTATQCPKQAYQYRARSTCDPCPEETAGFSIEVYRPSLAGTLTAKKPTICAGDDDVVTLANQCGDSIQWQISKDNATWADIDGALGPTTWLTNKLLQDTWYRVQVGNGPCSTVLSRPAKITVTPKPKVTVVASGPAQVCAPKMVILKANGTPSGGSYQWLLNGLPIQGATGSSYTATQSGSYAVVYKTGCGTVKSKSLKVLVSRVVAAIAGACGVCPPGCVSLQGVAAGGKAPYTFKWSPPGSTGPGLNACPTVPTTYTLTATDALGCKGAATHKINICTKLKVDAGTTRKIPKGSSMTLGGSPVASGGTGPYTYAWAPTTGLSNPSLANPVATPTATTTYTVTVTDAKGCKGTAQVRVLIK